MAEATNKQNGDDKKPLANSMLKVQNRYPTNEYVAYTMLSKFQTRKKNANHNKDDT